MIAKELVFAGLTFSVTLITGDMLVDLVVGIATYSLARLFWWSFEDRIKKTTKIIKSFFKKRNE
tara:strand:- start:516 stop:707 length:192 start_codon:yes stop_codon:yes gene_type:complete